MLSAPTPTPFAPEDMFLVTPIQRATFSQPLRYGSPMDISPDHCSASNILELPDEMLFVIFDMLRKQPFITSARTFKCLSLVCTKFHFISNDPKLHPLANLIKSIRPLFLMQASSNNIVATPNGEYSLELFLEPTHLSLEAAKCNCTQIKWVNTGEVWDQDYFRDEKKKAHLETFKVINITLRSWECGGHWYKQGTKQNVSANHSPKISGQSNSQLSSLAKKIESVITTLIEKAQQIADNNLELKEQYREFGYLIILGDINYSLQPHRSNNNSFGEQYKT